MTISSTIRTAGPFNGNGTTTDFPFSYKVFSRSDVLVAVTDTATNTETIKTLDADYTVFLNADQNTNPGGIIRMLTAPPAGTTLAATSNIAFSQSLDLTNQGGFYPRVINDALDRIVIQIQQLAAKVGLGLNVGAAAAVAQVLTFIGTLAGLTGSSLVGHIGTGANSVMRTVQDKLQDTWSAKDFGAKGDGTAFDDVAIQWGLNAVAAAGGGELYLPPGTYKLKKALVMDTGVYAKSVSLRGAGRNTILSQTGAGEDGVKFSTTQFLQNSYLRDLQIVCSTTSGHCVNIVYGCTTCFFDNLELVQNNPSKSCVFGDYTSFGGGIYDTKFRGGNWYCSGASTTPGFKVVANGTIFNENVFENIRCYNSNTLQFFHITTAGASGIWLTNNNWKSVNFEVCKGGGFHFDSAKNWKIENVSFWDAGGAYTNHLIDMVGGVGYESVSNTFINVTRNGDSLAANVRDIRIVSGQDTVLINCYTQLGDNPSNDMGGKRYTSIGRMYGVLNGGNGMQVLPDLTSSPVIAGSDVYGDTLHVGGRALAEAAQLSYSGGYTSMNNLLASSGILFQAKDGAGNPRKLGWTATELFPLTDGGHALGLASNRWTQVYATTATISTSDENAKDHIQPIDPAVLRAWAKVQFCQYKFKDAVTEKADGARWHFGVIAQRVKAAFESEGLDAFAYGLLCFDQWDATPAVLGKPLLDDDGEPLLDEHGDEVLEVVMPAREAGQRYGIRYEEALALECAYLRSKLSI